MALTYVKDFGAKGDGVTDDREAIQRALDYAINNNSSTVIFAEGVYKISSHGGTFTLPRDDGSASPSFKALGDTDIKPEKTNRIRCGLIIRGNVSLKGEGRAILEGDFALGTAISKTVGNTPDGGDTINSMACMLLGNENANSSGFTRMQVEDIEIKNFFIGMLGNNILNGMTAGQCFNTVSFTNCAIAGIMRGADNAIFEKLSIYNCYAGIIFGGWWTHRNRTGYTNENLPPYPSKDVFPNGWVDFLVIRDVRHFNLNINYTSYALTIDQFFDQYFFKSQNSATTANGGRRTNNVDNTYSENYVHKYYGIVGRTVSCLNRYGRPLQNVTVENAKTLGVFRDEFSVFGRTAYCSAFNVYSESCGYSNRNTRTPMINTDTYPPEDRKYYATRNFDELGNLYRFNSPNTTPTNLYKEKDVQFEPKLVYRASGSDVQIVKGYGRARYTDGIVHFELYLSIPSYTKVGTNARLRITGLPFAPHKFLGNGEYTFTFFPITQGIFDSACIGLLKNDGEIELVKQTPVSYLTENNMQKITSTSLLFCSGSYIANRDN